MLDIFANVFGKSKKSTTGASNGSRGNDYSPSEADGFVIVPAEGGNAHDRNVMLTNEMIMGSSSSIISNGNAINSHSSSSILYPKIDNATNNNNANMSSPAHFTPYSSRGPPMAPPRRSTGARHFSPIDNVPMAFLMNVSGVGAGSGVSGLTDDSEIVPALGRVEQFLNGSSSAYLFRLENSILNEALAWTTSASH